MFCPPSTLTPTAHPLRQEKALWADAPGHSRCRCSISAALSGAVALHVVENASTRRIVYSPDFFPFPATSCARLPRDLGSRFRVMVPGDNRDWLSFLGSSYFRSAAELDHMAFPLVHRHQHRGSLPEEFPRFPRSGLSSVRPSRTSSHLCLADGPAWPGPTVRVHKSAGVVDGRKGDSLCRSDIAKMGVAPLPEVLVLGSQPASGPTGARRSTTATAWRVDRHGERIWRPSITRSACKPAHFRHGPARVRPLARDRPFTI